MHSGLGEPSVAVPWGEKVFWQSCDWSAYRILRINSVQISEKRNSETTEKGLVLYYKYIKIYHLICEIFLEM